MSRLSRRRSLAGAASALGGLLAACGEASQTGAGERPAITKEPVTINLLHHSTLMRDVFDQHFPAYRAMNPNVAMEHLMVRDVEVLPKSLALFAAGTGPELFIPYGGDAIPIVARNLVAELDYRSMGLTNQRAFVDAYAWPEALDYMQWKGKYYGIPTELSNYCLYVNNRLFRKAGLDPQRDYPKTWEDLVTLAPKLTVRQGDEITQRAFEPDYGRPPLHWVAHAYQLAGPWLAEATGQVNITTEGHVRTLQWWQEWGTRHRFGGPKLPYGQNEFAKETIAMWASGSWFAAGIRTGNPDLFTDMSVKPFPRWRDKKHDTGSHVYGYAFMASKQAKPDTQAVAWNLAWYLAGFPEQILRETGRFQPKKDFVNSDAFKGFKDVPDMHVFVDDMRKSVYFTKSPANDGILKAFRTFLPRAWAEGQPPRQVLDEMQRELSRVIAEAGQA